MWMLVVCVPLIAAESTFHLQGIPLANRAGAGDASLGIAMGSVTIAPATSVSVDSCVGGTPRCPDPTPGYASFPLPAAILTANTSAYITWMFQDLSYTGPVVITIGFLQNGAVIWTTSDSHSQPIVTAGTAYLGHFATVLPNQASPGPAMVVVSIKYGGAITRALQAFTVAAASGTVSAEASVPAMQMLSVTIAALSTAGAFPCVGGTQGCADPTPGYASIPFPAAVLPTGSSTYITWIYGDVSYIGAFDVTVAFTQNGGIVGEPRHFSFTTSVAGFVDLMADDEIIPPQASPGPATIVVSLNYGGRISRTSQEFSVQ